VNLIGTFNVTRLAAAAIRCERSGRRWGARRDYQHRVDRGDSTGRSGSALIRHRKANRRLTLPLARDLARHAVRVMTIAPGIFDTPLLAKLPEEARASLGAAVPASARLGQPAEFASSPRQIIENLDAERRGDSSGWRGCEWRPSNLCGGGLLVLLPAAVLAQRAELPEFVHGDECLFCHRATSEICGRRIVTASRCASVPTRSIWSRN
jgi:hypothetical protein